MVFFGRRFSQLLFAERRFNPSASMTAGDFFCLRKLRKRSAAFLSVPIPEPNANAFHFSSNEIFISVLFSGRVITSGTLNGTTDVIFSSEQSVVSPAPVFTQAFA